MRFTISGGLFRAAYYGAIGSQAAYNHERLFIVQVPDKTEKHKLYKYV
jgi:hypothetical protein